MASLGTDAEEGGLINGTDASYICLFCWGLIETGQLERYHRNNPSICRVRAALKIRRLGLCSPYRKMMVTASFLLAKSPLFLNRPK